MIYVSRQQLKQVEYLISQSIQGNHVLFDADSVRRAFIEPNVDVFDESLAYSVEPHIERLILLPTLEQKRAYLDGLDIRTREIVIRTYFNIVENNLYENLEERH